MPHSIVLAGCPTYPPEKTAQLAITPGMLLAHGTGTSLRPHNVADGGASTIFAVESLVPSNDVPAVQAIDKPYALNDAVRWVHAQPGVLIYALVPAAAAAIVEGDDLVSAGDGTLKKATGATAVTVGISRQIVAKAAEAVNNSGGGTAVRIRARVV